MKKILSLLLTLVFSVNIAFAQVAEKNRIFVFDEFQGGIASKPSEYSLSQKYATVAENVRLNETLGGIEKREKLFAYGTADTTEAITGMHRLYLADGTKKLIVCHGDEIEVGDDDAGTFTKILDLSSSGYRWQWINWHNIAIGTDGYNSPVKYDGSSASATYLGSCLAVDAGSGAGPNGTYHYKVSYYTTSYEVIFNVASNAVTVTDNDITLTMIPIAPDTYGGEDVIGRKIYRHKHGASTYYLLTNGTIADNSTVTLTDSDADGELSATTYPAGDSTYTPPKGRFLLVNNNRLFIANLPSDSAPSRIHYSEDSSHEVFVTDHYFNIRLNDGDEITFIKNLLGILTIGKTNTIQKLYTEGDDPATDWGISDPFSFTGCVAPYSVINTPLGIIYLGNDGIYNFNGQYSMLLSDIITPEIKDIQISNRPYVWSELFENKYYMAYTSIASGSSYNDRILIYDLLTKSYSLDLANANAFCVFGSGTDSPTLYVGSSADGKVYSYSLNANEIVHSKESDFAGTFDDTRMIGTENAPIMEIAWDCDIDGWLTELQTKDASIDTIDSILTYLPDAIIDRPDTDGTYISQVLNLSGISAFDKAYWNYSVPGGGSVTLAIRAAGTEASCETATFSDEFTTSAGSDISAVTAGDYVQYRLSLSTNDINYSALVNKAGNYAVRITYNKWGSTSETTIPIRWASGWLDMGAPGYKKTLRKIYAFYDSENTGTLNIKLTAKVMNDETRIYTEVEDTFAIDLSTYGSAYSEYFTGGALTGEYFKLDISENSINPLKIYKIILVGDIEPIY